MCCRCVVDVSACGFVSLAHTTQVHHTGAPCVHRARPSPSRQLIHHQLIRLPCPAVVEEMVNGVRNAIMISFTQFNPQPCLTRDDLQGLTALYPTCGPTSDCMRLFEPQWSYAAPPVIACGPTSDCMRLFEPQWSYAAPPVLACGPTSDCMRPHQ